MRPSSRPFPSLAGVVVAALVLVAPDASRDGN